MPVGGADLGRLALEKVHKLEQEQITLKQEHLGHERLCAERYERIDENQQLASVERQRMHEENKQALAKAVADTADTIASLGGRIDRLYNRAWAVAATIISAEGAILLYLIKRMMDQP